MLDPRRLRTELDALKAGLARRDVEPSELDRAAALDERQRQLVDDFIDGIGATVNAEAGASN